MNVSPRWPLIAEYLGTLSIAVRTSSAGLSSMVADTQDKTFNQKFVGQQLGPNEVITKCEQQFSGPRTDA